MDKAKVTGIDGFFFYFMNRFYPTCAYNMRYMVGCLKLHLIKSNMIYGLFVQSKQTVLITGSFEKIDLLEGAPPVLMGDNLYLDFPKSVHYPWLNIFYVPLSNPDEKLRGGVTLKLCSFCGEVPR